MLVALMCLLQGNVQKHSLVSLPLSSLLPSLCPWSVVNCYFRGSALGEEVWVGILGFQM